MAATKAASGERRSSVVARETRVLILAMPLPHRRIPFPCCPRPAPLARRCCTLPTSLSAALPYQPHPCLPLRPPLCPQRMLPSKDRLPSEDGPSPCAAPLYCRHCNAPLYSCCTLYRAPLMLHPAVFSRVAPRKHPVLPPCTAAPCTAPRTRAVRSDRAPLMPYAPSGTTHAVRSFEPLMSHAPSSSTPAVCSIEHHSCCTPCQLTPFEIIMHHVSNSSIDHRSLSPYDFGSIGHVASCHVPSPSTTKNPATFSGNPVHRRFFTYLLGRRVEIHIDRTLQPTRTRAGTGQREIRNIGHGCACVNKRDTAVRPHLPSLRGESSWLNHCLRVEGASTLARHSASSGELELRQPYAYSPVGPPGGRRGLQASGQQRLLSRRARERPGP